MDPIILLAGGLGTRLRSITGDSPKILAPVGKTTFLEYLLRDLQKQGATQVVLSLHYEAESILRALRGISGLDSMHVSSVIEESPLDTGGAVRFVCQKLSLSGFVYVGNGDTFVSGGWKELDAQCARTVVNSLGLVRVSSVERFGQVEWEQSSKEITGFSEKTGEKKPGWIYSGMARLSVDLLQGYSAERFSLERDFYPSLLRSKKLMAAPLSGEFIDIGIPKDYERFCANPEVWVGQ